MCTTGTMRHNINMECGNSGCDKKVCGKVCGRTVENQCSDPSGHQYKYMCVIGNSQLLLEFLEIQTS